MPTMPSAAPTVWQRFAETLAELPASANRTVLADALDAVFPGEWDLTLTLLPAHAEFPGHHPPVAFQARLQILGVIREWAGTGRDYEAAAERAFFGAARLFGGLPDADEASVAARESSDLREAF